ncbi:MAG: hypothetical protein IJW13_05450 [Clostridia bacterium]|nr:hypothetical protein [Clostridia bacterium]
MKQKIVSEQLKRACSVIKSDRMCVSSDLEGIISSEIAQTLSDYFSLFGEIKTQIEVSEKGFTIKINAQAKSVKQLKIIG